MNKSEIFKSEIALVDAIKLFLPEVVPMHEKASDATEALKLIFSGNENFKYDYDNGSFIFYAFRGFKKFGFMLFTIIFTQFIAYFDDVLELNTDVCNIWLYYFKILKAPGNDKLERLFNLMVQTGQNVMCEKWFKEMFKNIHDWASNYKEGKLKWENISEKEFLKLRIMDAGVVFYFKFCEIDAGLELPDNFRKNDPDYQQFYLNAALVLALQNDIMSLKRDLKRDAIKFNYIYIKMINLSITAEDSVKAVISECKKMLDLVYLYGNKLKDKGVYISIPYMDIYVDHIFNLINGTHYWSMVCNRYIEYN